MNLNDLCIFACISLQPIYFCVNEVRYHLSLTSSRVGLPIHKPARILAADKQVMAVNLDSYVLLQIFHVLHLVLISLHHIICMYRPHYNTWAQWYRRTTVCSLDWSSQVSTNITLDCICVYIPYDIVLRVATHVNYYGH